jgi:ribonuclease J
MKGFAPYADLAAHEGYDLGRDLHVSNNGNVITLVDE